MNAESALVYCAITDPSSVGSVEVSPCAMSGSNESKAWAAILKLHSSGERINVANIAKALGQGGSSIIGKIIEAAAPYARPGQLGSYAELINQEQERRELQNTLVKLSQRTTEEPPATVISDAFSIMSNLVKGKTGSAVTMADVCAKFWEELEYYRRNPEATPTVQTGIDSVDHVMPGHGLALGALHIVGGSTGMGKSSLLQTIALNVAETGAPVDYYTFEDDPHSSGRRMISRVAMINNRAIQGYDIPESQDDRVRQATDMLSKAPLSFYESHREIESLSVEIQNNATKRGTRLICVDYLQKLSSRRVRDNRNLEMGNVAAELFSLSRKTGAAVLAASQLRRLGQPGDERRPTLGDLRDSGELEQHAHTVMLIWRDKQKPAALTELEVAKQKNGEVCTLKVRFTPESATFEDVDQFESFYDTYGRGED